MHYQQGSDREQVFMTSLEQLVAEDSFARIVDLFVDAMAIEELGFKHARLNREGNTPYHPGDMFKLLLYGYRNGLRSSTKLSKACYINLEVMWLMKGLKPSPRTINYFRSNNAGAIEKASKHFVQLLKKWKLVDGKTIAIDGTKVRGQNSLKNNFNARKIKRHIDYLDQKMGQYVEEEKQLLHNKSSKSNKKKVEELRQKMDGLVEREHRFEDIQELIDDSPDGQVSLTDPDAKAVIKHRNIVEVGYNIQTSVDGKHNIIIDQFCGGINDLNDLGKAVKRSQQVLNKKNINVLADAGYNNGAEIAYVERLGAKPFISPKKVHHQKQEGYRKIDFQYDKKIDAYICPQDYLLEPILKFKRGQKRKYTVTRYATPACADCSVRQLCTTNIHGRYIERPSHQEYVDRNDNRVNKNKDYYRRRQAIVEHPFGTLKRQWHMDHALVKGKSNVITEYRIAAMAYNLCRSLSVLGRQVLIERLKRHISSFLVYFRTLSTQGICQRILFAFQGFEQHIYMNRLGVL